ncbi:hypothetical protein GWI33_000508, partial [Rhynchophorus ferrugineus]
ICQVPGSRSAGVCCQELHYVDPWPSANLINGIDDGKYAEDDSLGQYHKAGRT